MAIIRSGDKAALVVVDTQIGVLSGAWDTTRVIGNVALAVQRARRQGVPVIWVQHADTQLVRDSADWQLVPELSPAPGEPVVHKAFESSFENTTLERELAARGVSHVVLAGAMSNWCVRATAYGALDRGYDLTLLKDAHTTAPLEFEDGFRVEAQNIVRELNLVMHWLSYPGRKCSTAAADEVAFPEN